MCWLFGWNARSVGRYSLLAVRGQLRDGAAARWGSCESEELCTKSKGCDALHEPAATAVSDSGGAQQLEGCVYESDACVRDE